ncbi:MAG: hypothetical protein LBT59_22480 [Clostridiales bacterium]|nr:hypothetical protein [Clostridiales bacterium]
MPKSMIQAEKPAASIFNDPTFNPDAKLAAKAAPPSPAPVEAEPRSALAMGLPESWSIEPPTMVVRRKARSL